VDGADIDGDLWFWGPFVPERTRGAQIVGQLCGDTGPDAATHAPNFGGIQILAPPSLQTPRQQNKAILIGETPQLLGRWRPRVTFVCATWAREAP